MAQRTLLSLRPEIHGKGAIRAENGTDYTSCAPERTIGIGQNLSAESLKTAIGDAVGCAIDVKGMIRANDGTDRFSADAGCATRVSDHYLTQSLEAAPRGAVTGAIGVER